jgi:hypothetical protein
MIEINVPKVPGFDPVVPKPTWPKREQDCPAIGTCRALGTVGPMCFQGAELHPIRPSLGCSVSVVLLLARLLEERQSATGE